MITNELYIKYISDFLNKPENKNLKEPFYNDLQKYMDQLKRFSGEKLQKMINIFLFKYAVKHGLFDDIYNDYLTQYLKDNL